MEAQKRILLVDDDTRTVRRLAQMLRDDGYFVEVVCDGAAAIARLGKEPLPDALVMEMNLPYASGVTVARYAQSRSENLPIIFVTGYPELVGNATCSAVFTKPIEYGDLTAHLARVVDTMSGSRGISYR